MLLLGYILVTLHVTFMLCRRNETCLLGSYKPQPTRDSFFLHKGLKNGKAIGYRKIRFFLTTLLYTAAHEIERAIQPRKSARARLYVQLDVIW